MLRRFGLTDHFVKVVMQLHFGAKAKVKIGEKDSEVDSTIGVRQSSLVYTTHKQKGITRIDFGSDLV